MPANQPNRSCPDCSAPLADNSPLGPCPACLMKLGMNAWQQQNSMQPVSMAATIDGGQTGGGGQDVSIAELAEKFPQFELLHLVGKGGMGTVYCARQKSLDRLVALKIIRPEANQRAEFADRFIREAKAMAQLNHPNIITVHEFGESDDIYFFVMEYVDGINLRQMLQGKKLSAKHALEIVPAVCDALQYAHDKGIVHRDIKPENILIDTAGHVKIADFGLAKLLNQDTTGPQLTRANHIMGTMHYMAPEQIEAPLSVDHRADIYSLGVVIYELLTGELPLGRFAPPSQKVSIDVRLDEIVLHTLEKEPALRFQKASQVKSELKSVSSTPAPAKPEPVDDLFDRAVATCQNNGVASISLLQRELRVGYGRGARLIEQMVQRGVLGPPDAGNRRQVTKAFVQQPVDSPIPLVAGMTEAEIAKDRKGKPPVARNAASGGRTVVRATNDPLLPGPIPNVGWLMSVFHPQTWANAAYLLLSLPLGILYFVFTVVGLSLGLGTMIIWIGIPILLATFTVIRGFMSFDRTVTRKMLRTNVPVFRYRNPNQKSTPVQKAKHLVFSGETWKGVAYFLSKLLIGTFSFSLCIIFVTLPLAFIFSPVGVIFFDGEVNVGIPWLDDYRAATMLSMVGLVMLPGCVYLINRLAWINAEWAKLLLTSR